MKRRRGRGVAALELCVVLPVWVMILTACLYYGRLALSGAALDRAASAAARYLATVFTHNADGTSSVQTYEGGTMRALGQLSQTPPYNAWIQDGRVVDAGPNLPLVTLEI